ncbi:MAG TPA: hypothetical protein VMW35_14125 [Myxococcota bacterium]|jgi:hypothetical protein|nr:hypothetical protein [Myxococcota bacterium]
MLRSLRPLRALALPLLVAASLSSLGMGSCAVPSFRFVSPERGQLSLAGDVGARLLLPRNAVPGTLAVSLDGQDVTAAFASGGSLREGTLANLQPGTHRLEAEIELGVAFFHLRLAAATQTSFETVALQHPDECDVLNDAECLLPYPSSKFLVPAHTPTGYRLQIPQVAMPSQNGKPLSAAPYDVLDGYSPTAQVLMHFPGGGVDPVLSDAPRIDPTTRTYDDRSLDADSPTVLIDADTGERILHFTERDSRAPAPPDPYADLAPFFLRPARSLVPGHRYIVAVRNVVHPDGSPVHAEAAFAALRDRRPTDIPQLVERRAHMEDVFARLRRAGVRRSELVLAFDWVVQSDEGLTSQMLSMRDQAFAWLALQEELGLETFTVDPTKTVERDCSQPGTTAWREIEGTYRVPLFLTSDPVTQPTAPGVLTVDAEGTPVPNGFTNAPFTIAIPCTVFDPGLPPPFPIYLGHGLFGTGRDFVKQLASELPNLNASAGGSGVFNYIPGGTDWRGLSAPDLDQDHLVSGFVVGTVLLHFDNFPALADRMKQGQLNALVLARMMKRGVFNSDPAFQKPSGEGVFPGPEREMFYAGGSLGGIMGLMFGALSPDVNNVAAVVPAINFSLLLERATPFIAFQPLLAAAVGPSRIKQALVLTISHELWVRGEPAGYATHITRDPLPGTNAKHVLITEAWLDHQVSNVGTEIAARTLGLPSLVGSFTPGKAEIPDLPGPLPSAYVTYTTGALDPNNPAHLPNIPPLGNLQVPAGLNDRCDPHGEQVFIPAAVRQLLVFMQPGGQVENFCNGLCDADQTLLPGGLRLETPRGQPPCNPAP